jgi:hypothetical protein
VTVTNEPPAHPSRQGHVGGEAAAGEPRPTAGAAAPGSAPAGGEVGRAARVEAFRREIAELRVRDPATGRDRLLGRAGIGLMVAGLLLAVGSYFLSHSTTNPLQQRDAIVAAIGGLAGCVVGAALFLRASLAAFLRFWLARLSYEAQIQTDRIIEHLER